MQETMQYLGFNIGYRWWTPAASKAEALMDAKVQHEDPKKGLQDVRSFIGACNFYRRHIRNFTCTSAILTDLYLRRVLPGAGALKNNKRLTSSRRRWPTLSAWACLEHGGKISWCLTPAMCAEVERCSSGKH